MSSDGFDGPRDGEFIPFHRVLSADIIPGPDAPYFPNINEFALTFDAYEALGGFEPVAEVANAASDRWHSTGELPDDLVELRTCLFFEQRRQRHLDQAPSSFPPEGEWMRYVRALVEAIRAKVVAGDQGKL